MFGTVGYMSPEQVRGRPVDHRSDIFSFGTVLTRCSRERIPSAATSPESMTAILKEDPPEVSGGRSSVPPTLERIVRRCLGKERRGAISVGARFGLRARGALRLRFQGYGRASNQGRHAPSAAFSGGPRHERVAGRGARFPGRQAGSCPRPRRPSSASRSEGARRGPPGSSPDGQTIVYSAAWDGGPIRAYSTGLSGPESRPLDLRDADVVAVSRSGELAVLLNRKFMSIWGSTRHPRAYEPLAGGAPRELLPGRL